MQIPQFGINRQDASSVAAFAVDVARIEALGWDAAWLPDSQLRRRDTYVLLAAAAQATSTIRLGVLLTNPVTRHPSVTASSIATIDELAPGRVELGWGAGDTAVRCRPAPGDGGADGGGHWADASAARRRGGRGGRGATGRVALSPPRADLARGRRTAHAGDGRTRRRRRLYPRRDSPGADRGCRVAHPPRRGERGARPAGCPPGRSLSHRAGGRPRGRADAGQGDGGGLLRVLADAVRAARSGLGWSRPRSAQGRARRLARLSPRSRPLKAGRAVDFLSMAHADAFALRGASRRSPSNCWASCAAAQTSASSSSMSCCTRFPTRPAPIRATMRTPSASRASCCRGCAQSAAARAAERSMR